MSVARGQEEWPVGEASVDTASRGGGIGWEEVSVNRGIGWGGGHGEGGEGLDGEVVVQLCIEEKRKGRVERDVSL